MSLGYKEMFLIVAKNCLFVHVGQGHSLLHQSMSIYLQLKQIYSVLSRYVRMKVKFLCFKLQI